jgi:ribosomal protein L11 methyltransferase
MRTNAKFAWIQVCVPVNRDIEDAVANFLFELGSSGCLQNKNELVAYFDGRFLKEQLHRKIVQYLAGLKALGFVLPPAEVNITRVTDQDWNALWKRDVKPVIISKRLIIKPSWVELSPPKGAIVIEIDPKQAFGTGSHATTRLALQFLERYLAPGQTGLDVGTGSGVLAIAAAKLGAANVVALDNDPVAVAAARENVQKNSCAARCRLLVGEVSALRLPPAVFDVIVANINKNEILKLLPDLVRLLKSPLSRGDKGSCLFITGLLREDENEIVAKVSDQPGCQINGKVVAEEWMGLIIQNRG